MKLFFSFVMAVAVATLLSPMLAGRAIAAQSASTGTGTCTGRNADGTVATWTMSGGVYYTSSPGKHYVDPNNGYNFLGYYNYAPNDPAPGTTSCSWSIRTSSDIKPNCAGLTGKIFIHYIVYPGYGGTQTVVSFTGAATVPPNYEYNTMASMGGYGFSALSDVKNVQYKVSSLQAGSQTTWEVATSYL